MSKETSGRKSDQKMKPYLVYQYLLRNTDENTTKNAYEIADHLNSFGIEAEQKELIKAYHLWERNFPMPGSDDSSKRLRKAQLEDKIQALQDELKKMDEE